MHAKSVQPRGDGGCTCADAPSADTSAVVTVLRINMRLSTLSPPDIPWWRASNLFKVGFTIMRRKLSFGGLGFCPPEVVLLNSQRQVRPIGFRRTGNGS